jgi:hypothetical protein
MSLCYQSNALELAEYLFNKSMEQNSMIYFKQLHHDLYSHARLYLFMLRGRYESFSFILFIHCLQLLSFWTLSIIVFFKAHNVLKTGFCLRLQVEPTQLGSIDRAVPYLRTPTESESELLCDWHFIANQLVFVTSPLILTTSNIFFSTEHLRS